MGFGGDENGSWVLSGSRPTLRSPAACSVDSVGGGGAAVWPVSADNVGLPGVLSMGPAGRGENRGWCPGLQDTGLEGSRAV